eukprot:6478360-Pyramimonas_sp.AAC.1
MQTVDLHGKPRELVSVGVVNNNALKSRTRHICTDYVSVLEGQPIRAARVFSTGTSDDASGLNTDTE